MTGTLLVLYLKGLQKTFRGNPISPSMVRGKSQGHIPLLALVLALCLSVVLLVPAPVGAHAVLVESAPENGAALRDSPRAIVLRFNATLERAVTFIDLVDLDQVKMALTASSDSSDNEVVARVPPLQPGVYSVVYKVLARDGHVTEGSIRFTILER